MERKPGTDEEKEGKKILGRRKCRDSEGEMGAERSDVRVGQVDAAGRRLLEETIHLVDPGLHRRRVRMSKGQVYLFGDMRDGRTCKLVAVDRR
jgi:hypothetical protein